MERAKHRWLIAAAAVGIHLSIGSIYALSVFAKPIVGNVESVWGLDILPRCRRW
jgi:OFA family oxalate/formate antiporter-like MFS transporter